MPPAVSAFPLKSTDAPAEARAGVALGRLTRRADFLLVSKGRRAPMPGLLLQARPREPAPHDDPALARFGFTATKKLGGAVVRNRVRRRLRALVRQLACASAEPGYDYVLIAREGTLKRPFAALCDDFRAALRIVHRQGAHRGGGSSPAKGGSAASA